MTSSSGIACPKCGGANAPGGAFCVHCGTDLRATAPPARGVVSPHPSTGPSQPADSFKSFITEWIADAKRQGWKGMWPFAVAAATVIVYTLLSRNLTPLLIGIGLVWVLQRFYPQFDKFLEPVWPYRDRVPRRYRLVLAWVAPAVIAFIITSTPSIFRLLAWLPIISADSSVLVFITLIGALIGYILVREPQRGPVA